MNLPSRHIADIQASYEYFGIPQSHGNYDEEARKTTSLKDKMASKDELLKKF